MKPLECRGHHYSVILSAAKFSPISLRVIPIELSMRFCRERQRRLMTDQCSGCRINAEADPAHRKSAVNSWAVAIM
jgi:hypothetical protein